MGKHTLTGNIKLHRAFRSGILGNRRDIWVYLPPGYRRFSRTRYPVLYLHDGQNVFDAATSFAGVEWGVDETLRKGEVRTPDLGGTATTMAFAEAIAAEAVAWEHGPS